MCIYFFISKSMAKKRWSVNDYKIVEANQLSDGSYEYSDVASTS